MQVPLEAQVGPLQPLASPARGWGPSQPRRRRSAPASDARPPRCWLAAGPASRGKQGGSGGAAHLQY
jgi:hypothetical protein